jgi:hypothetical protein
MNSFYSVFEAFSFLLDDGNGYVASQQTMNAPHQTQQGEDNEREQNTSAENS